MYENARLGFHLSVQGNVANAPMEAMQSNYRAFQIFVTNPRSWSVTDISGDSAAGFRRLVRESGAVPFAHMPYLCNPSSPRREVLERSIGALKGNMRNCETLGVRYLVAHVGSHLGSGAEAAMHTLTGALSEAMGACTGVDILLENSSGYRNSMGSSMDELGRMIDSVGSSRLGVCLDTCHAYANGYDVSSRKGTIALMDEIESSFGLDKVKLVHLNDSRYELGSKLDRHWNIGKGHIGRKGFVQFFGNSRLKTDYFVMETPVSSDRDRSSDMRAALRAMREADSGVP